MAMLVFYVLMGAILSDEAAGVTRHIIEGGLAWGAPHCCFAIIHTIFASFPNWAGRVAFYAAWLCNG